MINMPAVKMNVSDLRRAAKNVQVNTTASSQGGAGASYLHFGGETGEYVLGRDRDDVKGMTAIINITTCGHGWVLWHQRQATKRFVHFTQALPEPLAPIGRDYPSEGRVMQGVVLTDDGEAGDEFIYETNTVGGRQCCDMIMEEFKEKADTGSDYLFPKIVFESRSYTHKTHNKTFHNPVFRIIDWCNENGESEKQQPAIEQQPTQPTTTRQRQADYDEYAEAAPWE